MTTVSKIDLFFGAATFGNEDHIKVTIDDDLYEIEVSSLNYNCHSFTMPFNMGEDGDYYQYENDDTKIEYILAAIREKYDDFDVSKMTYRLLDDEGHGIEGEEYDMMSVYKGQEDIRNQIANVYNALDNYYRSGNLDKAYKMCNHSDKALNTFNSMVEECGYEAKQYTGNKYIDKLVGVAEEQGWKVTVDGDADGGRVAFHKDAPSGYSFFFETDLPECDKIESDVSDTDRCNLEDKADYLQAYGLVNNVYDEWFNFDAKYETSIRVDDNGHGINGAPYEYSEILSDMQACESYIESLHRSLYNTIHKENPSKNKNNIEKE